MPKKSSDKQKKIKLKGKYAHVWLENSFEIKNPKNNPVNKNEESNYLGTSINNKKIILLILASSLSVLIIIIQVFFLQIIKGDHYRALAESNRVRIKPIISERGIIYDKNKIELTQNIPNFSLILVPQDLPSSKTLEGKLQRKKIIKKIVEIAELDEKKIEELLDKYGDYSLNSLIIKEDLDYEVALRTYLASDDIPGISILKGSKRKYLMNEQINSATSSLSLSHILGYLGKLNEQEYNEFKDQGYLMFDNTGKTGLEKIYQSELRGYYGSKKNEVDANGREKNIISEINPVAGKNLILTLDIQAQIKMEELLKKALKKYEKKKAIGIAMDPRDGSILAMVSWPSFNNNDFSGGISQKEYEKYINNPDQPLFNRAISGTYPSGSIIKTVMVVAALQERIINYNTSFFSKGGLQVDRWFFPDWLQGGHGLTNATRAIAWSVNTFFYYIGGGYGDFDGLGVEKIKSYMQLFNLGKITGIDLPEEEDGLIPDKNWKQKTKQEMWYIGDTYNLSIGQGDLLVTPLQATVWTSAIANGGYLVQPHFLHKIEDSSTQETQLVKYNKEKIDVDPNYINIAKIGMRECVTYGSCPALQTLNFMSGGKTGTAQWNNNNKQNHAWFTSFAPYNNPEIVVTILIEEGEGGATTAQPVARDFLEWWGKRYLK
ncbi:MAG: penicillin-binding protein 2 [bacterium]